MSKVYQTTHVGKVRKNNEDALIFIEPETFAVADGMGGQAAGEVASQMLIDITKNFLSAVPEPWSEDILKKAILKSNAAILREARNNPNYRGMGTTATILHIYNRRAYYAHVGDSRLYRLKNKILEQMTQDHSYVENLVRRGEITAEAARVHPMKNILTQAVGAVENVSVDTASFSVEIGDIFLLCTDGLTNMVEDKKIAEILLTSENPAEKLVQAALDNGGLDNISVIVIEVDSL
ncbi:MAG: Stp1/IreP family PP2C-type Ser/Thr phosphatase [Selenomonadaceae bacterium]|nr:Stp1/IreP family PP2C-type Ser/Thr phosphatase [Selenomonadaceae bacterium]